MDGKVLDEKEVSVIATLSLEEARAKIVGIPGHTSTKISEYFACTWLKNC